MVKLWGMPLPEYQFNAPGILAFMGIPCSGKSTIARILAASLQKTETKFEVEEEYYPEKIKLHFTNRKLYGYYDIFCYFREQHIFNLKEAVERKAHGLSTIVDCYYEKVFFDFFRIDTSNWFIDKTHPDFTRISKIADADAMQIPNVDIFIFLKVSQKFHKKLLKSRGRVADMGEKVFDSQAAFLQASQIYCEKTSTPLLLIEQEEGIERVATSILKALLDRELISLNKLEAVRNPVRSRCNTPCYLAGKWK